MNLSNERVRLNSFVWKYWNVFPRVFIECKLKDGELKFWVFLCFERKSHFLKLRSRLLRFFEERKLLNKEAIRYSETFWQLKIFREFFLSRNLTLQMSASACLNFSVSPTNTWAVWLYHLYYSLSFFRILYTNFLLRNLPCKQ